jgi:hypothetical protein
MRSESWSHLATIVGAGTVSVVLVTLLVIVGVENLSGWHEADHPQLGPSGPTLQLRFRSDSR